jgi:hypothetical protein
MLANLSDEIWFAGQLRRHGVAIFDGLTTPEQRAERARAGIAEKNLGDVHLGKSGGRSVTFGMMYEKLYGPLPAEKSA